MARIRTLKPSFWTDQKVVNLSRDARLLLVGIITQADDDGRLPASPVSLIGALYPHDEDVTVPKVKKWLGEIDSAGIVHVYQDGKATYAALKNWRKHQVINKRTASVLPPPPEEALF